jgi:hypothetical protein
MVIVSVVKAIVLVAVVARLAAVLALGDGFHFTDEADYADAARRLLGGEGFGASYQRVPGYPLLLALLGVAAPSSLLWLRLAQAAVAGIGAALVFVAAERLIGRLAAIAAAAVYALDPLLVVSAGLLYPEAVAALLLTGAVLLTWEASRRASVSHAALAGAVLGILAQFRPAGLAVVPLLAAWLYFATPGPRMRRLTQLIAVGLACVLVLVPWTYRNYQVHGRLAPVSLVGTKGGTVPTDAIERRGMAAAIVGRALDDPTGLAARMVAEFGHFWEFSPSRMVSDDAETRAALHQADPRLSADPAVPRTLRDLVSAATFAIELAFAVGGMILLWRTRRREAVMLVVVVLGYALAHSLFIGKLRYRITVLPLVFIITGAGVAAVTARFTRHRARS